MLEVLKDRNQKTDVKKVKLQDVIVTKFETVVEYKDNCRIEKQVPKKVNVTKLVNETKKLIKTQTAEEKLNELEKIFSK